MTYSSSLNEADSELVVDASVLINLLATHGAVDILAAVGVPVLASEHVIREVEYGEVVGRRREVSVRRLQTAGVLEVVQLSMSELDVFGTLVSGSAVASLGDGEAATIAIALCRRGNAIIDERKATRLCAERFPPLLVATTIDILCHERVSVTVAPAILREAVLCALRDSRMQVRESQYAWIVDIVGPEAAEKCPTLRRLSLRRATRSVSGLPVPLPTR